MTRSSVLLATLLGVSMSAPAQAQSWADFADAFPLFPCHDGWSGCLIEEAPVQPDLGSDSDGLPVRADLRVGWFDLQPTAAFSPFVELSSYSGELRWQTGGAVAAADVDVDDGVVEVSAADIEAEMDDAGKAAIQEAAAAAEAERNADADRAAAEAAAAEATRQQEEAARQAQEQIARQKELEAAAAQANAEEAARLREEAAEAARRAAEAEATRKAAAEEARKKEAERKASEAAQAEAKRLSDEKRQAEEAARKKAEDDARKKAEDEARKKAEADAAAKKAEEEAAAAAAGAAGQGGDGVAEGASGAAVASAASSGSCEMGELVRLEPQAMLGKLNDPTIAACETTLSATSKMTDKGKVSRVLMVNAFSKGDKSTWEKLVKRHLDEIDQSDPDLCYKYSLHLSKKGPSRASGVIRWADVALENRTVWTGDTYTSRVYSLYKLRAAAANTKWQSAEGEFASNPGDATGDKVEKYRAMTKVMAREWYEYAKVAGKDTTTALQLCMSAAGTKDYCEAG